MRAGSLRQRITFQQLTVASDSYSKSDPTWTDQLTTYGAVWPLRGVERMEALKLDNEVTHKVRVRFNSEITAKMRIKYIKRGVTRYLNITSLIDVEERGIYIEILASEEV